MNRARGFSLIELMIVVAIVAILAALAYPSYQESVRSSKRGDCEAALEGFANAMERRFTTNNSYLGAANGGANIGAPAGTIFPAQCPLDGGSQTYTLAITAASATTYTVQATPAGAQVGDRCGSLTLDNVGRKGMIGAQAVRSKR